MAEVMSEVEKRQGRQLISILVPCYNEEAVLREFYRRTAAVIDGISAYDFQFMFVNDGSKDGTLSIMRELHEKDSRVSYVNLSRNFGKEIAMTAGIDYLTGDAAIIMDADLQDPPELIPELIHWWEQGYQDVSAKRRSRAGETFFKKWSSHAFYTILQKLSNAPMQRDRMMRESQRYNKGLFSWIGFEKKEILFDRDARAAGKTKWNYWKLLNLAIEGITSFTTAPLRAATYVGIFLAFITMIYMLFIIGRTILFGEDVPGYPSLISIILFIGGVQLSFLGIIGEYLGRVFNESKFRPLYLVQDVNGDRVMNQDKVREICKYKK